MSMSLRLFEWFLKAAGIKAKYDRPVEDINRMKEKINKGRTFTVKPMKGQTVKYNEILVKENSVEGFAGMKFFVVATATADGTTKYALYDGEGHDTGMKVTISPAEA